VLITFSERVASVISSQDTFIRMGGDEFIVWSDQFDEAAALKLARNIEASCNEKMNIENLSINVQVSIGIALVFRHAMDLETLMNRADLAMYTSKGNHLGPVVYHHSLSASYLYEARLRNDLSETLQEKHIFLMYQPKVCLTTGAIMGVEGLARWKHPKEGLISPIHFIPLVENSVHIHKFTRYIIEEALLQQQIWMKLGIEKPIAINISPYNLLDSHFTEDVGALLQHYEVPVHLLEIELTETALMNNIEATKSCIKKLKSLGIKIALDDFGTGISSLTYVSQLDANYLKIDKSFVMNMTSNTHNKAIIEATLGLTRSLGWHAIAEGIETREQLVNLIELGCQFGQGYLFDKPLSSHDMEKRLLQNMTYTL
jgi:diguanylate cyclase